MTDYVELNPPLFPARLSHRTAETGDLAQKALLRWVRGGTFHPYAKPRHEEEDWEPGEQKDNPGVLEYEGRFLDWGGYVVWGVHYNRAGDPDPDAQGSNYGYSSAEDAAYAALTLIEEYERERYLSRLVVGIA